ncbi:MAG: MBL fold metallo-hydrolase [Planctomycetota bacterium]|nr:MBL fold metallo-hydrolase [Planctomycetota bacterium]
MQFGDLEILFLRDGAFKLDGGAMFGIVPKPLWQKEVTADERNRMVLSCNCPLIRTPGGENILIDCGLGRKWNEKQREIYAISESPNLLEDLAAHGLKPGDVTILAHTHLHLDHCGWNTKLDANGKLVEVFPNARHVVERRELGPARKPNEIQRGTYLEPNIAPLDAAGRFEPFDERLELAPGVTLFRTGGHTIGHVCVRIESGGRKAIFIGEMMPTVAHRHLPWVMAYDLFPLETLEAKRALMKEAIRDDALVLLNHDPNHVAVKLKEGERGKIEYEPVEA